MTDNANARWRLTELPGRTLVLVKNFAHHNKVRLPFVGTTVAVAIRANGIAIYAMPTIDKLPPDSENLLLVIPAGAITMENLEDLFPVQAAAEIFLSYRLNRRHLLQLIIGNVSTGDDREPGNHKRKEV
ncbi:MAG: hypothetical protein CXR31_00320 [Geobacter sp.]|nr:MAG: hypothetical protein CXR31_00320 [Geobacter sp.]